MTNEATAAPNASTALESRFVYAMAVLSLIVGLPIGYLLRGSNSPAPQPSASAGQPSAAAGPMADGRRPTLGDMKQAADKQAGPLLEKLKGDPNNAALLGQIGAVYDSMHQFTEGAVYYNRAVQADPGNAVFRNKLAISLYSNGDADGAIAQLNQALAHDPGYADALFNLGMIKLKEKQDGKGALAAWQQLLKSNPKLSADRKAIVRKQIAGVASHAEQSKSVGFEAMNNSTQTPQKQWTAVNAISLMVICLLMGIAGGWWFRGWQSPPTAGSQKAAPAAMPEQAIAPAQMAEAQAAPLLEKLKSDPNNPDLLTGIGNIYYDAQQYPAAVDYYGRALKAKPADAAVRTDMATAYWYMGNADTAIAEFNKALTYEPNNPNTLFNLGIVKWKGKMDVAGAEADWKKLLKENPNYEHRDKVQQTMAEAEKQAAPKPQ